MNMAGQSSGVNGEGHARESEQPHRNLEDNRMANNASTAVN
jgi:hypothetical protein